WSWAPFDGAAFACDSREVPDTIAAIVRSLPSRYYRGDTAPLAIDLIPSRDGGNDRVYLAGNRRGTPADLTFADVDDRAQHRDDRLARAHRGPLGRRRALGCVERGHRADRDQRPLRTRLHDRDDAGRPGDRRAPDRQDRRAAPVRRRGRARRDHLHNVPPG